VTAPPWIWWAPLAAAALHIVEEFFYPGGFAEWDRAYRPAIRDSITPRFHFWINAGLLLLCAQVGLLGRLESTPDASFGIAAWLALAALLISNTVFHIVGTVRTRRRSPGVVTGLALYVPMATFGYWTFIRSGRIGIPAAIAAALIGGSYHLWAALAHNARAGRQAAE
jgi:hypothetical protein